MTIIDWLSSAAAHSPRWNVFLIAEAVHRQSGRRGPFVALNCGALSPGLVESELFGHRKGTFTGATENRAGGAAARRRGRMREGRRR
jgi:transcriptional regulator with PAS, ATPase and Fis domain